ncbi:MAG: cyclic nucleotide-binding domain-containing protein, partial [Myxococcota bacterium]
LAVVGGLRLLRRAPTTGVPRARPQSVLAGGRYLVGHPFPRGVAALAAAYAALGACVDYVFRVESAGRLTEGELAALFGDLNAVVGGASIAYQLLLTGRVLERGGLFLFLGVVPTLLAVMAAVSALTGFFWTLVVVKGLEMAGSFSIQQSGMQLLYNPMPPESRPAVRAFVDGLVKKGGMALAGMGLAVLVGFFPQASSPWLVTGLALGCLLLIRGLRGGYVRALEDKLRGSRARVVTTTMDVEDKVTRAALHRALQSPSGAEVLAALSILRRDARFKPAEHLGALLVHPDESVRVAAMDLVPEHPGPDVEFALASALAMDQRRPRAAAARAFARCTPERAGQALRPFLTDPDPGVTCAVIAAIHPLPDGREAAEARLSELLSRREAADAAERREVARVLGELPPETSLPHLRDYLEDTEPSVRALAMKSAAALGAAAPSLALPLVPVLQARLAVRSDRAAAREALAQLGDHAVPLLRRSLDDRRLPLAVRIEIPRLLCAVGTDAAAEALLFSNIKDHPSLRWRIAESLFHIRRAHPSVHIDLDRTNDACRRRLAAFLHYRPLCHALFAADETAPKGGPARRAWDVLCHATTDRLLQNLDMAVKLLGLHRGEERMLRAAALLVDAERAALGGATSATVQGMRADALELIDVALGGDSMREEVMRVLEPPPPSRQSLNVPWRTVADTARALRASADPLVSALARRVLRSGVLMPEESSMPRELPASEYVRMQREEEAAVSDPTDLEEVQNMDESLLNRILTLERVDLFEGLPVDDVAAIAGIAEERHAEAGEVLYREGEPGNTMMVLVSGRVQLIRGGHVFMELGPGESIGQVSLLDRGPRPTTAVVRKDSLGAELLVIHGDTFLDLVTDRPELTRGLFVVLAKRLRALIDLQGSKAAN